MAHLPMTIPLKGTTLEQAARALVGEPGFACIDARGGAGPSGRFSLIAAAPSHTFSIAGAFVTVDGHTTIDTPYSALRRFCALGASFPADPYLPFSGGVIGYIGFEGARAIRGLAPAEGFSRHSQCRLGLYPAAAIFDHVEGTAFVIAGGADRRVAQAAADRLIEGIETGATPRAAAGAAGDSACGARGGPGDASFRQLVDAAQAWIRSEHAERLHVACHRTQPQAGETPLDLFFHPKGRGEVRALFTHEGACYIVGGGDVLIAIDGDRVLSGALPEGISIGGRLSPELSKIDALVAMIPSEAQTGAPYARALDFIERHEEAHRALYGGAFGVLDARRLSFYAIEWVETIADETIAATRGGDLDAEGDPRRLLQEMERFFAVS